MQRQLKILETLIHCSLRIWPVCRKETSFTFRQTEIEYEWKTHIKERWWSNWTLKCSKTTLLQTFKSLVINLFALSNRIEHISLPLCAVYVNSEPVQQSFPIKLTTFYLLSVLSKKLYCQVTLLSVSFKPRGKNVQGESAAREPRKSTILFLFALYICKTPAVLTRIPLSKKETETLRRRDVTTRSLAIKT